MDQNVWYLGLSIVRFWHCTGQGEDGLVLYSSYVSGIRGRRRGWYILDRLQVIFIDKRVDKTGERGVWYISSRHEGTNLQPNVRMNSLFYIYCYMLRLVLDHTCLIARRTQSASYRPLPSTWTSVHRTPIVYRRLIESGYNQGSRTTLAIMSSTSTLMELPFK